MSQIKQCPKCNSNMSTGTLKEIGHYGNPPFEFAPDDEKPFQVPAKGMQSKRKQLALYCCENCGFIEFYGK